MNHKNRQFALILFRVAAALIVLHTVYEIVNVLIHGWFLGIPSNVPTAFYFTGFGAPIVAAILLWFIAPPLASFVSRIKDENV